MPIDPNIPLQAGQPTGPFGPDLKQVITLQNLAQQMQARQMVMQQEQQGQNALKQVYGDPKNIDPSGYPTANAMRGLIMNAPSTGLSLMGEINKAREADLRVKLLGEKVSDEHRNWAIDQIAVPATAKYREVLQQTGDPKLAQTEAQKVYSDAMDAVKADGRLGASASQMSPTFNYSNANANIMGRKGLEKAAEEDIKGRSEFTVETDAGKVPPIQYKLYKDGHTTDMGGNPYDPTGIAAPKGPEADTFAGTIVGPDGKPQPITVRRNPLGGWIDDKNQPVTGEVTNIHRVGSGAGATASPEAIEATADLIARYKQAAPGSYAMSRGNGPEIMKVVRELNPNFDATKFPAAQRMRNSFAASVDGRRVDSINTAVQHLGVLSDVGKEMENHDVNLANRIINYASVELGHPEVTDFDTAKGIIADEVIKSVVGTGAVFDRAEMQKNLNSARSPQQLQHQIDRIEQLMGGSVASIQRRWTSNNLPEDEFRDKLLPDTLDALDKYMPKSQRGAQGGSSPSAPSPGAEGGGPPSGAFKTPDGKPIPDGVPVDFGPGKGVWRLKNGQPERVSP